VSERERERERERDGVRYIESVRFLLFSFEISRDYISPYLSPYLSLYLSPYPSPNLSPYLSLFLSLSLSLSLTKMKMMNPTVPAYIIEVFAFLTLWAVRFFLKISVTALLSQKKKRMHRNFSIEWARLMVRRMRPTNIPRSKPKKTFSKRPKFPDKRAKGTT
jgi:hypothetical protein